MTIHLWEIDYILTTEYIKVQLQQKIPVEENGTFIIILSTVDVWHAYTTNKARGNSGIVITKCLA